MHSILLLTSIHTDPTANTTRINIYYKDWGKKMFSCTYIHYASSVDNK